MALVNKAVEAIGSRLPKIISPKVHAIIDYATIGSFVLMGALFWKNNKRAAIAAWSCGAVEATTVLLTDFPGGVADVISFETHGKLDASLAGTVATLPNLLGFSGEPEAKHFRIQGGMIAGVTAMTRFKPESPYESEYDAA
jgi:hypothetical protein